MTPLITANQPNLTEICADPEAFQRETGIDVSQRCAALAEAAEAEAPEAQEASPDEAVAEESSVETEESGEASPEAENEASGDSSASGYELRPRAVAGLSYSLYDLGNGDGLDHGGAGLRLEGGVEFLGRGGDVNPAFQLNLFGTFDGATRDLGEGTTSSINTQQFGLNARAGISLADDWVRLMAGLDIGAVHVGADECEDGESCGAVYTRNPILLPIDNFAMLVAAEAGISVRDIFAVTLGGGIQAGVNPNPALLTQPDNPDYGLNIPFFRVMFNLNVGAAVMSIMEAVNGSSNSGGSAEPEPNVDADEHPTEPAQPSEPQEPGVAGDVAPVEPSEPSQPEVQGLALIQENLRTVRGSEHSLLENIRTNTQQNLAAFRRFQSALNSRPRDMEQLRVLALEVYVTAQSVIRDYNQIQDLIAASNRERLTDRVSSTENREALQAIAQMRQTRNGVARHIRQSFNRASAATRRHNGVAEEDIPFELQNPTPRQRTNNTERETRETPEAPDTPSESPEPQPQATPEPQEPANPESGDEDI